MGWLSGHKDLGLGVTEEHEVQKAVCTSGADQSPSLVCGGTVFPLTCGHLQHFISEPCAQRTRRAPPPPPQPGRGGVGLNLTACSPNGLNPAASQDFCRFLPVAQILQPNVRFPLPLTIKRNSAESLDPMAHNAWLGTAFFS